MENKLLKGSAYLSKAPNLWASCSSPQPHARLRLFCFPYAGAGSSTFNSWYRSLPAEIELHLVHIPGRDKRFAESPSTNLMSLAGSIAEGIYPFLDKPFAFYGHSMGGLLSFEVARRLRDQYSVHPVHLFISSHRAPQLPDPGPELHHLPDEELLQEVQVLYGALPEIVLQDPEILRLFLPIMRADFAMIESYRYEPGAPLQCPITVFGGIQDGAVNQEELAAWHEQTVVQFEMQMFEGDHFFIQAKRAEILRAIHKDVFARL